MRGSILEAFGNYQTNDETAEAHGQADFNTSRSNWLAAITAEAERLHGSPDIDLRDADIRFSSALNLREVRNAKICIIGAGGLGNWQWRILASMGFRNISIYDDDTVGLENVGPQAHSLFDLGLPKVEAVANAVLQYRGMRIIARNRRVYTLQDIIDDLGFMPDIIIGCTDSAEFRNGFIDDLVDRIIQHKEVSEVFLDFRMALGDWCCYAIPARAMRTYTNTALQYQQAAVFPPEEAVQEACTERAIAYTGAGAATFTGAFLHWYYTGGRNWLAEGARSVIQYFERNTDTHPSAEQGAFKWYVSYSSRDWEPITDTLQVKNLRRAHKKHMVAMENQLQTLKALALVPYGVRLQAAEAWPGDQTESILQSDIVYVDLPGPESGRSFRILKNTGRGLLRISCCARINGNGLIITGLHRFVANTPSYTAAQRVIGVFVNARGIKGSNNPDLAQIDYITRLIHAMEGEIFRYDNLFMKWELDGDAIKVRIFDRTDGSVRVVTLEEGTDLSDTGIPLIENVWRGYIPEEVQAAFAAPDHPDQAEDSPPQFPGATPVPVRELNPGDRVLLHPRSDNLCEVVAVSDGVILRDTDSDETFHAPRRQETFWRIPETD